MAGDFDPRMTDLFGASYGREAATNDKVNADLESTRANAMAMRGQGLQSMFNVKKDEAMLPFDLDVAKANADPELLNAKKSTAMSEATMKAQEAKQMLLNAPAKELEAGVRESMMTMKSILAGAVSSMYAGSSVDTAVQSAIKRLPPAAREKFMEDPANLEQLMQWTKTTDPQAATQQFTASMSGIDAQLEHLDPEMYRQMALRRMEDDQKNLDRQSQERIADKEIAQRSSSSRENSLSTDKNLVLASEQRYPMPPNATPEQRNQILDLRQQWISQHKVASIPGFASVQQTDAMEFGDKGFSTTKTTNKTPNTPAAPQQPQPQARQQAPAQSDRVVIKKGGKQFTVPRSQLQDALKQGYTQ